MRDEIVSSLFSTSSKDKLLELYNNLDLSDSFCNALAQRIMQWLKRNPIDEGHTFESSQFLSSDLSAVIYGRCPTIFMGTNHWALKRNLNLEELKSKVEYFSYRMKYLANSFSGKICFVVVPEKDVMMDKLSGRNNLLAGIDAALLTLRDNCDIENQIFVYDGFVQHLPNWVCEDDYEYADSHLLTRDYFLIFKELIRKLGYNPSCVMGNVSFAATRFYGDLNEKFGYPLYSQQQYVFPKFEFSEAKLVAGSSTFESPLGDTMQIFRNDSAKIDKKVAIFGDSHSSIINQKRFTYMFSSTFKHCEFHWIPWGGIPEDFKSDADIVIMEIAQRFIFT